MSFYLISGEKNHAGAAVDFAQFAGKVVYGVNVASRCGYTASGYALLSKLSKMEGVAVLLFPCNQFGGQEPGTNESINEFCTSKGVEGAFVFEKADVNGAATRPVYDFLRHAGVIAGDVSWNFAGKFVVDKSGNVTSPKDVEKEVVALLAV